jgi:hypothetical protein
MKRMKTTNETRHEQGISGARGYGIWFWTGSLLDDFHAAKRSLASTGIETALAYDSGGITAVSSSHK